MIQKKRSLLSQRGQMFVMATALFIPLAAWSLSAFWQHIDTLKPTYQFGAKLGAAGGEVALFIMIVLHCFNKHIGVRKWALILSLPLGAFILAHTGALRGLDEAGVKQDETETRLAQRLTEMSKEQAASIGQANRNTSAGLSQKERLANESKAKAAQAEVMKGAQSAVAQEITARTEKIKESAIFPKWYLDGWMYAAIFIVSLACFSFVASRMMNEEDIDADFDGVPDREQNPQPRYNGHTEWEDDPPKSTRH